MVQLKGFIIDADSNTGALLFVSLPPRTLSGWLAEKHPAWEVQAMLIDVAHAIAFTHTKGVAHRNLSPDCIAVADGRPVLTGFEYAALGESLLPTDAVHVDDYRAPEAIERKPVWYVLFG